MAIVASGATTIGTAAVVTMIAAGRSEAPANRANRVAGTNVALGRQRCRPFYCDQLHRKSPTLQDGGAGPDFDRPC
jgi:hypothetical protein